MTECVCVCVHAGVYPPGGASTCGVVAWSMILSSRVWSWSLTWSLASPKRSIRLGRTSGADREGINGRQSRCHLLMQSTTRASCQTHTYLVTYLRNQSLRYRTLMGKWEPVIYIYIVYHIVIYIYIVIYKSSMDAI